MVHLKLRIYRFNLKVPLWPLAEVVMAVYLQRGERFFLIIKMLLPWYSKTVVLQTYFNLDNNTDPISHFFMFYVKEPCSTVLAKIRGCSVRYYCLGFVLYHSWVSDGIFFSANNKERTNSNNMWPSYEKNGDLHASSYQYYGMYIHCTRQ